MSAFIKAAVAGLVVIACASAADATERHRPMRRAYPAPPPVHQWTGFYGGVNLGYGLAGITDNTPLAITSLMHGIIGGVQVGYNYQIGSLVLGVEADIQGSDQNATYTQAIPGIGNLTIGHGIPYFGTARGRVGYAFTCGCVIAYATAGVAYGAYEPFATLNAFTLSKTFTRVGFAGGAGVEWMVSEHWSAKLEALYLDTGNLDGIDVPVIGTIHMRVRDAITRIGLNYHF